MKALEEAQQPVSICKQAMVDANDDSCRAMYTSMMQDYKKHEKLLNSEIEKHKEKNKWD